MTDLFNQLTIIFGESVGIITLIILGMGLMFMIIEFFIPGFAVFGVTGLVISIGGIVYRIVNGLNFAQSIILVIIYGLLLLSCYIIFILSLKNGLLSRSQLFSKEPSIPYDYDNDTEKKLLLGKEGITSTICKPIGKAVIDGKEYEVLAEDSYLDKDTNIKVIEITDDDVVVSKI